MSVLFVLPTAHPVTSLNMNYAIVAIGGLIVLTTLQYVLWGGRHYNGIIHTFTGQSAYMEGVQGGFVEGVEMDKNGNMPSQKLDQKV